MNVSERLADIAERLNVFYVYMDNKEYKKADKVFSEIENIVGTTDHDIASARK